MTSIAPPAFLHATSFGDADASPDPVPAPPAMPLVDLRVEAVFDDLHGVVTLEQVWRNDEDVEIEGVYTFPLPEDAAVLEVEVTLGDRRLEGTVVPCRQAEADYEAAVTAGHAAVMLEQSESGIWTINVGNLKPAETARIRLRYARVHAYSGETLRVALPTTIAPRYGAWPHAIHQAPAVSLTVEHRFEVSVRLVGGLADAQVRCPTHAVRVERADGSGGESGDGRCTLLRFAEGRAAMDRDLVLEIVAPRARRDVGAVSPDIDGRAALARWQPSFGRVEDAPLRLVVVVDCSGSMAGDSIAQAREAVSRILDALRPQDRIGLVLFGSEPHVVTPRLCAVSARGLVPLRRALETLDADLGGTEIESALDAAATLLGKAPGGHVLLITDGQAHGWEPIVDAHRTRGHRVFPVGVGAAVAEGFLRTLATATRGQCEFVTPNEAMAGRIVRHFERMRAPQARSVRMLWPEGTVDATPAALPAVFSGDTVLLSARLPVEASADEALEIVMEDDAGREHRHRIALRPADAALLGDTAFGRDAAPAAASPTALPALARLAAAQRLAECRDDDTATAIAVRYRLGSRWTHWLVIAERAEGEATSGAPALRQVPGMLAAGWGGTGTVMASMRMAPVMSAMSAMSVESVSEAHFGAESLRMPTERARIDHTAFRMRDDGVSKRIAATHRVLLREALLGLLRADPAALDRDRILETGWLDTFVAPDGSPDGSLTELVAALGLDPVDVACLVADLVLNDERDPTLDAPVRAALSRLRSEALRLRAALGAEVVGRIEAALAATG